MRGAHHHDEKKLLTSRQSHRGLDREMRNCMALGVGGAKITAAAAAHFAASRGPCLRGGCGGAETARRRPRARGGHVCGAQRVESTANHAKPNLKFSNATALD